MSPFGSFAFHLVAIFAILTFSLGNSTVVLAQDDPELTIDTGEPFNPNTSAYCQEEASEAKNKCEKDAKSSIRDPKALDEALWECWLKWREEIWLKCFCRDYQFLQCQDTTAGNCRKEYFRCRFRAQKQAYICLMSGRSDQECNRTLWEADKACKKEEAVCNERNRKRAATFWR
jgi:hypothetical protein